MVAPNRSGVTSTESPVTLRDWRWSASMARDPPFCSAAPFGISADGCVQIRRARFSGRYGQPWRSHRRPRSLGEDGPAQPKARKGQGGRGLCRLGKRQARSLIITARCTRLLELYCTAEVSRALVTELRCRRSENEVAKSAAVRPAPRARRVPARSAGSAGMVQLPRSQARCRARALNSAASLQELTADTSTVRLLSDIATAVHEDGSATLDDEHCCYVHSRGYRRVAPAPAAAMTS